MPRIFISYRREDSGGYAILLYNGLAQHFGNQVFKDIDNIQYGVDFVEEIERAVSSCDVLIAIIGKHWLTAADENGQRRLDDPEDFVCLEIQVALQRNVRVIPILVGGSTMPKIDALPDSIEKLARRQAFELNDARSESDILRLIQTLEKVVTTNVSEKEKSPPQTVVNEFNPMPPTPPEGMALVSEGSFLFGNDRVTESIHYNYCIDIYPVTNTQYLVFIMKSGYEQLEYWSENGWQWKKKHGVNRPKYWNDPRWNNPVYPVVGVSFYEAEAYARFVNKRLPTVQEWEKSARGTEGRIYPWGDEFDKTKCNSVESELGGTTPVTKYGDGVSPYGCFDMAGNVWEWTTSREQEKYAIICGGSWLNQGVNLRSANRCRDYLPSYRHSSIGVRCATNVS